jgi:hypothetical protein
MDEKNNFICNFFKLNAQGRKAFYLRRKRQNGNPNHGPLGENFPGRKELNCIGEQFLLRSNLFSEKGTKLL